jgi:hypothetical protein
MHVVAGASRPIMGSAGLTIRCPGLTSKGAKGRRSTVLGATEEVQWRGVVFAQPQRKFSYVSERQWTFEEL